MGSHSLIRPALGFTIFASIEILLLGNLGFSEEISRGDEVENEFDILVENIAG